MATDPNAANPTRRSPWTCAALRRPARAVVAAAADEVRSAAVSAAISGVLWWLGHH